ncbi:MAG TPA: type II toxin-antitoxin system VapC family toxin [Chloroflexi bacterium]|nr:type II toxin-antitoxin system VapC family toxin [Chloroflexota bacterium]
MSAGYVLDTFAVIAYLRGEPAAKRVQALLAEAGRLRLYLCLVNYGEVIYISERKGGRPAAEEAIRIVDALPVEVVPADRNLTFAAAHIKAHHPLSYADAFAVALAQQLDAVIVTGDPEFKSVEGIVRIEWLE